MPLSPFQMTFAPQLRFGRGEALAATADMMAFGSRFVIVCGRNEGRTTPLIDTLRKAGATLHIEHCSAEPDLPMLAAALSRCGKHRAEAVIAIGGGSVIDLGKALAALLPVSGVDPMDHIEVVGRGLPLPVPPLPFIAIPTTAGTGSEATRNAVIAVPEHRRKVSLRDARMLPRLAIVDPSLMDGTPRAITMASGLDAVTQVIEPYLSNRANPMSDALCRDAIPRGLAALRALVEQGEDPDARDELAYVAHVSGIALANAGLGAVHGLAGVLGGETGAAHGAICGQLLAPVLLAYRYHDGTGANARHRIDEIEDWSQMILGCSIAGLAEWAGKHGLPAPDRPVSLAQAEEIARQSAASSSMKPSPVTLSQAQLVSILGEAGWVADGSGFRAN